MSEKLRKSMYLLCFTMWEVSGQLGGTLRTIGGYLWKGVVRFVPCSCVFLLINKSILERSRRFGRIPMVKNATGQQTMFCGSFHTKPLQDHRYRLRDHRYRLRDHLYGCRGGNRFKKGESEI